MAFRASEIIEENFQKAARVMIPRKLPSAEKQNLTDHLRRLTKSVGPVVDEYPSWHPLILQPDAGLPYTMPNTLEEWDGLDHTVYFVNGFLTCPYDGADGVERVNRSAIKFKMPHCAKLKVETLNEPYYGQGTTAILVSCIWDIALDHGSMIPKSKAIPLMLETELARWKSAQFDETWETMRPYLLGTPHGARSSLFVNQDTALALKKSYAMLVESGMFN